MRTSTFLELAAAVVVLLRLIPPGVLPFDATMASCADTPCKISDTTKDRFVNMYHFKDNVRSPELFVPTVLELGRVIQCSLSFFGCYSPSSEDQDGLLCDNTVSGIEQWVDNVCWPYAKIEVRGPSCLDSS